MNIFENKRFSKIIFNLIEKALGIKKGSIIDLKEQTQENEKNKGRGKYIYEQLSPKVNDDERYINEIDQGVDNKDIKNIALSGSYGSGKSSILKTYISKRDQRKYLNVSLAKFTDLQKNSKKETGKDTGNDSNKDVNIVNELEENILKQMFYKVHHNKIPYSRYKRIKNIRTMELLVYIVLFILIIISGIVIFNPKLLVNFDKNKDILKELKVNDLTILQMWAIFVITSFIAGIKLLKYFIVNLKLSNIKTKNIEITKSDNSSSIFNKNIDEILYFFEVNKYDVVIFEDIDRFDNLEIFVKLRELNDLINNSDQIDGKVTFIYAIKDDIFSDYKERTKFFDLIIPVIPIINSSNSLGIIKNKLKEFNIEAKLMDDISIYIDDMRLLINICNEFKLYKSVLEDIDESKLFAMIVYKNIYPSDFVKLQFNEGMIGELFDYKNKRDIINKIIKDLDQKYIDLENKIEKANEEFIDSIDELKSIYLEDISDRYSDIHIGNNYYKNYKDLKKVIFTDETKLEDNIEFTDFNGSRRRVSIKELSRYNEEDSYYKRKEIKDKYKKDMMTANEVRESFKKFFEGKGHKIVPSAPMVIKDDPTLKKKMII